ncbi:ABC transporter substrate-binding protein [Paenibacillus koleovorans]|uniref:ABC transporter substrate-binding protein n=1 Tax=Paenibacillus koleovorans TaxID=121608 RepID=UPI000FDB3148|nr:sugar ABC transporter substrate-binding protein [Paenibacillus koleovorans]
MKQSEILRKATLLAVILMLLASLAACGKNPSGNTGNVDPSQTGNPGKAEQPVKIKLWAYPKWAGVKGDEPNGKPGDWETAAVKRFMELHPHVTVETEYLNATGGPQKVAVAIQTNEIANVLMDSNIRMFEYARKGLMLPLDKYLEPEYIADYYEQIWENARLDGGDHYYLPWVLTPQMLMINRTLFKQAGVDHLIPTNAERTWTYDQFYEAAKAIPQKKPGVYGTGIFGKTETADSYMMHWFWSNGITTFDPAKTKVTLNNKQGLETFHFLKKLIDTQVAQPGAAGVGYNEVVTLFNQQKVASMTIATTGYARVLKAQSDKEIDNFEVELVMMPSGSSGGPASFVHEYGIGVFKNADPNVQKWSVELAKFLGAAGENAAAVKGSLSYSPRKSQKNLYSDNPDKNLQFASEVLKYAVDGGVSVPGFQQQRVEFGMKMQAVFTGSKTADAALKEFEQLGTKIITDARKQE